VCAVVWCASAGASACVRFHLSWYSIISASEDKTKPSNRAQDKPRQNAISEGIRRQDIILSSCKHTYIHTSPYYCPIAIAIAIAIAILIATTTTTTTCCTKDAVCYGMVWVRYGHGHGYGMGIY
jgi:hypothetical protein